MRTKKRRVRKKSQRPATEYNTLPTSVTRKEFNLFIKHHLSRGKRGTKTKLSLFTIFNHILYVLHTGIQWENLPVRGAHWSSVYRQHNRWSKDESYKKIFEGSLNHLVKEKDFNLTALHGDGSNVVAKKGELVSATRGTSISEVKRALISKTIQGTVLLPVWRRE